MVGAILADSDAPPSGSVLLVVNGFGGTPALELYLMYNAARRILEKHGLAVTRSLVGSYVTSLEMAGCSIMVTLLDDVRCGAVMLPESEAEPALRGHP
jgi:phosphoenolpyruvate---glycerone phosphotransferase subunit DhaK